MKGFKKKEWKKSGGPMFARCDECGTDVTSTTDGFYRVDDRRLTHWLCVPCFEKLCWTRPRFCEGFGGEILCRFVGPKDGRYMVLDGAVSEDPDSWEDNKAKGFVEITEAEARTKCRKWGVGWPKGWETARMTKTEYLTQPGTRMHCTPTPPEGGIDSGKGILILEKDMMWQTFSVDPELSHDNGKDEKMAEKKKKKSRWSCPECGMGYAEGSVTAPQARRNFRPRYKRGRGLRLKCRLCGYRFYPNDGEPLDRPRRGGGIALAASGLLLKVAAVVAAIAAVENWDRLGPFVRSLLP
jgi:rubredoxin